MHHLFQCLDAVSGRWGGLTWSLEGCGGGGGVEMDREIEKEFGVFVDGNKIELGNRFMFRKSMLNFHIRLNSHKKFDFRIFKITKQDNMETVSPLN